MLDPPYVALRDALDAELVAHLRTLADGLDVQQASFGPERLIQEDIRKAEVGFFPAGHWTAGLFFHFGTQANAQAWRFDVRGVRTVQAASYSQSGHYSWHTDSGGPATEGFQRKLTVVAPLSDPADYEGGKLQVLRLSDQAGEPDSLTIEEAFFPGSVIIFPAFMPHRVTPVTRGTRRSIVTWLIGPPFR